VFESLFAPTPVADFLARHWSRRALYAPGAAWRSELRFTLDDVRRGLPTFPLVKAQSLPQGRHLEIAIQGDQAAALFDAGLTICVTAIDQQVPELARFTARLRDELRFAGEVLVNAYWSPAAGGFGTHFDDQHVFILQVDGSKRWWVSREPACAAPPENLVHSPQAEAAYRVRQPGIALTTPDPSDFDEHLLRPGDCLYLPPGTWHRTTAGEFSLALTLTLAPVRLGEIVSRVVRRSLERALPWRETLPFDVEADATPRIGIPPAWRDFLEARIVELREFAAELTPEMLTEEWLAATVGAKPGHASAGDRNAPSAAAADPASIDPADVLVRERRLELCPARNGGGDDVVVLLWPGGRCEIPGAYATFCRTLAATARFTASEARRWTDDGAPLDADETRDVLAQLLRTGLLRKA
jgi:ribosomal protein L16 Arg81 hydroxylase